MTEWVRHDEFASAVAPDKLSDLLVKETTYETKVTDLVIDTPEKNAFNLVVRDHDASNPETKKSFKTTSAAELHPGGYNFNNPLLEYGANKEIAVQPISAGTDTYRVSIALYEHRP